MTWALVMVAEAAIRAKVAIDFILPFVLNVC